MFNIDLISGNLLLPIMNKNNILIKTQKVVITIKIKMLPINVIVISFVINNCI